LNIDIFFNFHSKKKKKEMKKIYNPVTLWGSDVSQVTPVWPHKSFEIFQLKFSDFEINEL